MESKMIFCKKCERFRAFYLKDGVWICCGCKRESKENNKSKN